MAQPDLPPKLAELVEDFTAIEVADRLQLLIELADELPALPARYTGDRAAMERVRECQTPLFLAVEIDPAVGSAADGRGVVRLFFDAPPEAPTTRGFAAVMHIGLDGESPDTVLGVPEDFYTALGLHEAVSPLRLRGVVAMLTRIKSHLR
jgi:cysteine desulfuration protein SufE